MRKPAVVIAFRGGWPPKTERGLRGRFRLSDTRVVEDMTGNGKDTEQPKVEQILAVAQVEVILTADGKLILNCHGDAPLILAALVMAQHSMLEKIAPKVGSQSKIRVPHIGDFRL